MGNEMMDLDQLAVYLQRDKREVTKMASRGYLPGHKVSGQWRFARAEINHWIETQLPGYTEKELVALEDRQPTALSEPLIANLISLDNMAVPLTATTRSSVLKELVELGERTWQVYDPEALLQAVRQREELGSTALPNGVAIPHPRRPLPGVLGDHVLAYGRSAGGIPFGSAHGSLTDIFFLVCCRDDRTHLQVLARLSRLMLRQDFLDALRAAPTPAETWEVIAAAERELVGG